MAGTLWSNEIEGIAFKGCSDKGMYECLQKWTAGSERAGGRYLSKPRESYKMKTEIISENWLNTKERKREGEERKGRGIEKRVGKMGRKKKKGDICKCLPMNVWEF